MYLSNKLLHDKTAVVGVIPSGRSLKHVCPCPVTILLQSVIVFLEPLRITFMAWLFAERAVVFRSCYLKLFEFRYFNIVSGASKIKVA